MTTLKVTVTDLGSGKTYTPATPKPPTKAWSTARLFYADLTTCYLRGINQRLPVAGGRLIWAVVGHKHVRCCTPITNIKWRMKRSEWDQMPTAFYG